MNLLTLFNAPTNIKSSMMDAIWNFDDSMCYLYSCISLMLIDNISGPPLALAGAEIGPLTGLNASDEHNPELVANL